MEKEYSTLCQCESCKSFREGIMIGLKEFPTQALASTICKWLNTRYAEMRDRCLNKKEI
jgi:hypothetical protein